MEMGMVRTSQSHRRSGAGSVAGGPDKTPFVPGWVSLPRTPIAERTWARGRASPGWMVLITVGEGLIRALWEGLHWSGPRGASVGQEQARPRPHPMATYRSILIWRLLRLTLPPGLPPYCLSSPGGGPLWLGAQTQPGMLGVGRIRGPPPGLCWALFPRGPRAQRPRTGQDCQWFFRNSLF